MYLKKYKFRQLYIQYIYRKLYTKIYNYLILLRLIIKNEYGEKQQKVLISFYYTNLEKILFKSKHKNICILTGSKRSILLFFKLNRMSLLDNINNYIFPGVKKAIW